MVPKSCWSSLSRESRRARRATGACDDGRRFGTDARAVCRRFQQRHHRVRLVAAASRTSARPRRSRPWLPADATGVVSIVTRVCELHAKARRIGARITAPSVRSIHTHTPGSLQNHKITAVSVSPDTLHTPRRPPFTPSPACCRTSIADHTAITCDRIRLLPLGSAWHRASRPRATRSSPPAT